MSDSETEPASEADSDACRGAAGPGPVALLSAPLALSMADTGSATVPLWPPATVPPVAARLSRLGPGFFAGAYAAPSTVARRRSLRLLILHSESHGAHHMTSG